MNKTVVMLLWLVLYISTLAAMDSDLDWFGQKGREQQVQMFINDYLYSSDFTNEEREEVEQCLLDMTDEQFANISDMVHRKKREKDDAEPNELIARTLMQMLKEMKASGEIQEKAYQQQVESAEFEQYKWRNRFWTAIIGGVLSVVGSNVANFLITSYLLDEESCG